MWNWQKRDKQQGRVTLLVWPEEPMHVDDIMTFPMRMMTTTKDDKKNNKDDSDDDFDNDVTIHN